VAVEWWNPRPRWFSPAAERVDPMRQNEVVSAIPKPEPEPEIKDSGLGWPADVSRETSPLDSVPDTGLGWPE